MDKKSFAIPNTTPETDVAVQVRGANGVVYHRNPRPPRPGESERIVSIRNGETLEKIEILTRIGVNVSELRAVPE